MIVLALMLPARGWAGSVELTTYLPMPHGRYKRVTTTGQTNFATGNNAGQAVGIGTATPTNIAANDSVPNIDLHITGNIMQENWKLIGAAGQPGFQSGFENCPSGWGYNSAGFFRDKNGIVHLRGLVRGPLNSTVFQLPAGYTPARNELFAVMSAGSGSHSWSRLTVQSNGVVLFQHNGGPDWYCLDGITFRASGY